MASIPIHNETDYALTEAMTRQILHEAHEHVGEEVRAIRVQAGLERHVLHARTREVRYAFAPQDFGLVPPTTPGPHTADPAADVATREGATEAESPPAPVEEGEVEAEDLESRDTSLESLDEGQAEDEEEDVFHLDDQHDDLEEEDEEDEE